MQGVLKTEIIRKDPPTVGKDVMRIMLTIVSSKSWPIRTTDIKSAFLQGKSMERSLHQATKRSGDGGWTFVETTEMLVWAQ